MPLNDPWMFPMEICTLVARVYVRISIVVSGVRLKYLGEIHTQKKYSRKERSWQGH